MGEHRPQTTIFFRRLCLQVTQAEGVYLQPQNCCSAQMPTSSFGTNSVLEVTEFPILLTAATRPQGGLSFCFCSVPMVMRRFASDSSMQ